MASGIADTNNIDQSEFDQINPLDTMEMMFNEHGMPILRTDQDCLELTIVGGWCEYHLVLSWLPDQHILYYSCYYNHKISQDMQESLAQALMMINQRLWLGHFELCEKRGSPVYRHGVQFRGIYEFGQELFEDIIDFALSECERFYPVFQQVLWGNKDVKQALKDAMIDCKGAA